MRMKRLLQMLCPMAFFISSSVLYAQQTPPGITLKDVIPWGITILLFIISVFLTIFLVKKKKKAELKAEMEFKQQKEYFESQIEELKQKKLAELEAQKEFDEKKQISAARIAEDIYRAALKEELGHIDLLGSPDIESKTVKLEEAFVSLCISEDWRGEERFKPGKKMEEYYDRHLTPEQAMKRAFQQQRLFLVIGDPGSGKTTLLKYYAVKCLDKKYNDFGFQEEVFPIYFPLRELTFENNEPVSLPRDLAKWSERHLLNISKEQFHKWLHNRKTLVLLDGLDEISSKEQRQKVCRWVKDMCNGLKNAFFVVTSRATGYRKLDGIEIKIPHLRADIMDFTQDQQEVFLKKWFRAVYLSDLQPEGMAEKEWKEKQLKLADQRSQPIIDFLKKEENKAVQELAAVPMLVQIMAIIWKERKHLPDSRLSLYDAALNYLLAYRDKEKEIEPLLPVEQSRRVLAPTALWMQEDLEQEEAPKEQMHKTMQPILNTMTDQPNAVVFCEHLRDRAGLIAELKDHYIFRHKSFREFLSGIQLKEEAHKQKQKRIKNLVEHFKDDWWEETLRFFMSKADDEIFDQFMRALFKSKVSQELNAHQQNLLQQLVMEAPQKRIDALVECLNSERLNNNQKRYVMDCLKTIGTPEAVKAIEKADKTKMEETSRAYAEDIIAESQAKAVPTLEIVEPKDLDKLASFRNPFEDYVEYIKIPGGTYKYSVTGKMVTVPDLYFCKYPVTNKRYRRFISYLEGKEIELVKKLPPEIYAEKLLQFAESIKEYKEYLGKDTGKWQDEFRSRYDDDKRFKVDDQPVVGITWYASRAYCFWLSCLDEVLKGDKDLKDITRLSGIYRLPTEEEWEWAAGGNPDGSVRKYPWLEDKGEPNPNLANFNKNVGATTPVGRYPEGATPHGLMDMAGNVDEWMENIYQEGETWRSIRGGSWFDSVSALRCSARYLLNPVDWNYDGGFRVVRAQS